MEKGITASEQFVYDICRNSFLSLWSYVNPQGRKPGKELCDILIVCDPHVVVISVKEIALTASGDASVDWARWERRAIEASIKQIEGAIRCLNDASHVTRKDGTTGLPLPPLDRRIYHRIAVACGGKREVPITNSGKNVEPLVHVLDEKSFYLILRHLDTISDLVGYLIAKEEFLSRTNCFMSDGEENLLAIYLHAGRTFPKGPDLMILDDDLWKEVSTKAEFLAKLERDQDSYVWDRLIESYCVGGFEGDTWRGPSMADAEQALRVLAKEDRLSRRLLGSSFRELLELSKAGKVRSRIASSQILGATYVFLAYSANTRLDDRTKEMTARCFASLCRFPNATTVIGIGVNVPGDKPVDGYSAELVMLQAPGGIWPPEFLESAKLARDALGYFQNPNVSSRHDDEYPAR